MHEDIQSHRKHELRFLHIKLIPPPPHQQKEKTPVYVWQNCRILKPQLLHKSWNTKMQANLYNGLICSCIKSHS